MARVPVPVSGQGERRVRDDLAARDAGPYVSGWNVYAPCWAPVAIADVAGLGRAMLLQDRDPYDDAAASRVFRATARAQLTLWFAAMQADGHLYVEVMDPWGSVALRLLLDEDGWLKATVAGRLAAVCEYGAGRPFTVDLYIDTVAHTYALSVDGEDLVDGAHMLSPVSSVARIALRTGPPRREPTLETQVLQGGDLPGADEPVANKAFAVFRLEVDTDA